MMVVSGWAQTHPSTKSRKILTTAPCSVVVGIFVVEVQNQNYGSPFTKAEQTEAKSARVVCFRISKPNLLRSLDSAVSLRRSLHWLCVGESELRHESDMIWSPSSTKAFFEADNMFQMPSFVALEKSMGKKKRRLDVLDCCPKRGSNSFYIWSGCSLSIVASGSGTRLCSCSMFYV